MYEKKLLTDEDLRKMVNAGKLRVLTKSGKWLDPRDVLFSSEYKPEEDLERLIRDGLLDWKDLEFLDPIFVRDASQEELDSWREFFEKLELGGNLEQKLR